MEFSVTTAHPGDGLWVQNLLLLATSTRFGAKPLVPFEQELKKARSEGLGGEFTAVLKPSIRRRKRVRQAPRVLSSWAMSDEVQEPLYVDEFHLNPPGNQIIAHAIALAAQLSPH
jgi:hypothetical protein